MVAIETKTDVKPKQPIMENGPYLEKFEQFEKGAKDPAWVRVARKAGISHFVELGFPTLQDEDWRFTNVAPIAKLPFEPVFEPTRDAAEGGECFGDLTEAHLDLEPRRDRGERVEHVVAPGQAHLDGGEAERVVWMSGREAEHGRSADVLAGEVNRPHVESFDEQAEIFG